MYQFNKPEMERIWLQNYGNIPANLEYPSMSMVDMMLDSCNTYHNYNAVKYTQNGITHEEKFDEFGELIELTAKMLKLNGVDKNDKTILLLPYLPEGYHSIYGVLARGASIVPLHPNESKSHKRMAEIIKEVKSPNIICLDSCVSDLDYIMQNDKTVDEIVRRILYLTPVNALKKKGLASIINPIIDYKYQKSDKSPESMNISSPKFASYASELKSARRYHGSYMENVKGEDEAAVLYTSGTSGRKPDGCIHTHDNFNNLAISGYHVCDCIEPGQKLMIVPGMFHCYGLETGTHTLLNSGVTMLTLPNPKDLEAMAELQRTENPEIHIHVPLLLTKMRKSGLFDDISYDNTVLFMSGGGAMSKETLEYWNNKLKKTHVREGYGNTQTLGGTCINLRNKKKDGTIGVPLPDYYYKLVDTETNEDIVEPNKSGEIYICGPSTMKGIVGESNPDCLFVDENGIKWYKTKDLAFFDEDGFFTFIDRKDDVLNMNSGNLVNPKDIRKVLEQFGIEDSVIFRKIDENNEYDEIIVCIENNSEDEIVRFIIESLEKAFPLYLKPYERPSEIVVFKSLPLNLNGKILKNSVQESYNIGDYRLKVKIAYDKKEGLRKLRLK